jgi:DnaJ-class molecular chaperone
MTLIKKTSLVTLLILMQLLGWVLTEKSYYEILGIPKNSSASQIKSAFRKLSKKYHPDVSKEDNARAIYQEISDGSTGLTSLQHPQRRSPAENLRQVRQGRAEAAAAGRRRESFRGLRVSAD